MNNLVSVPSGDGVTDGLYTVEAHVWKNALIYKTS